LILEKSSSNQPRTLDEPDFDRIYVLGYDKRNQEHYTAYRSPDLRGFLPAKIEGQGDNKTFTLRLAGRQWWRAEGSPLQLVQRCARSLKVNAPNVAPEQAAEVNRRGANRS
jgi:hypothetical protein